MSSMNKVKITITEIMGSGECSLKHKVGDSWEVTGEYAPEHFCSWAFQSMFPFLTVLQFGGKFPWGGDGDSIKVCCPDPANPVVFNLEKVAGQE